MQNNSPSSVLKIVGGMLGVLALIGVIAIVASLIPSSTTTQGHVSSMEHSVEKRGATPSLQDQLDELREELATLQGQGVQGPRGPPGPPGRCAGTLGQSEITIGGGTNGWYWYSTDGQWMQLPDYHVQVGDVLVFDHKYEKYRTSVWQFHSEEDYEQCNRFSTVGAKNATVWADRAVLRNGRFVYNVTAGDLANSPLYFGSVGRYEKWNYCALRNVKTRIFVHPLESVEILQVDPGDTDIADDVGKLQTVVAALSRSLLLQQVTQEQRVRSEGDSGITLTRGYAQGAKTYHDGSFAQSSVMNMHNHANNQRTMGMGEIQAVLNGVEFQTRHNDYSLVRACDNNSGYHCTQTVEFPDVPPEVLAQPDVESQVVEMQKWFKAFKDQDWSERDYRPYFRPVVAYLEGAWIKDSTDLSEPFDSDRHFIDASNWRDLHDKTRFLANSGRKNTNENLPFLPASIRNLVNDTIPQVANFEYRILVWPIAEDIPTSKFRIARDLHRQLYQRPRKISELEYTRLARWELNKAIKSNGDLIQPDNLETVSFNEGQMSRDYLDHIMEQIPGKDNAGAFYPDYFDGARGKTHYNSSKDLNAAYYSRFYKTRIDAMGVSVRRRGYHDRHLWTAHTTQERVIPLSVQDDTCQNSQPDCSTDPLYGKVRTQRWTYAVPLEIIYLTPLTKWNPYDIVYQGDNSAVPTENGRTGEGATNQGCTDPSKALDGIRRNLFYQTPKSFFASDDDNRDPADTSEVGGVCVLNSTGQANIMEASGHWIIFPEIGGGVGKVRQRYPIPPIHETGSTTWKELEALKDIFMSFRDYESDPTGLFGDSRDERYGLTLSLLGSRDHDIFVSAGQVRNWLRKGDDHPLYFTSEVRNGHQHRVALTRSRPDDETPYTYHLNLCKFAGQDDDAYTSDSCLDGHTTLEIV